jgi:uncharacterized protein YjbJ (UPF0337 family)
MGADDKIANKLDGMTGSAKEKVGRAPTTSHCRPRASATRPGADLKQAGEKVKDAFKH